MDYKCYVGIDISKAKLDVALLSQEGEIKNYQCENAQKNIEKFFTSLMKEEGLKKEEILVIAENTGHYSNPLTWAMVKKEIAFWLEAPAQIHLSQGIQRGKNDKLDAERIAIYGKRFNDKVVLVQPTKLTLDKIEFLNSELALHKNNRTRYKAQLSDMKGFVHDSFYKERKKRFEKLIKELTQTVNAIEKEIDELIKGDEELKRQMTLLKSITGIGQQIAKSILIVTKGFTKFLNPRKLACQIGIAPFSYNSGSSIRSANRVSKKADPTIKAKLHMAVMSVIQREGEFKEYYERKVKEGKHGWSIMNAIKNKLVHRMFSVIKNNRPYQKEYVPNWK